MSAMLARLAALKAKRAAAPGQSARKVDPALAAAAAAAGAPTRGTWDVDYAQRLRGDTVEVSDDESDDDVVVLPPPAVKLDPVAQREKWKRDMKKEARGRHAVEEEAEEASGFVFEKLTEDQDEAEGVEEETVEIDGEIDDEDQLLATNGVGNDVGSDADGDEDGGEGDGQGDETREVVTDGTSRDDGNSEGENGYFAFSKGAKVLVDEIVAAASGGDMDTREEAATGETKSRLDPEPSEAGGEENTNATSAGARASVFAKALETPKDDSVVSEDEAPTDQKEPAVESTAAASSLSRPRLMLFPKQQAPTTLPNFVDDQAEDEDGEDIDRDSDRDSDAEGEITAADALVPDDPGASPEPGAAVFHREWQQREEAAQLEVIANAGRRNSNMNRPRNDDNAMDLTELVASGAVVAASGGAGGDDCGSIAGDHGAGDGSDGELMDFGQTHAENYVEEM